MDDPVTGLNAPKGGNSPSFHGWRFALSIGMANFRNVTIMLALFLSAYTIFEWKFSLPTLAAMNGLVILTTGSAPYVHRGSPDKTGPDARN